MEKKKLKKLVLNKEHIAHLSNTEMKNVLGGGSTEHDFTCSWCTNLDGDDHTVNPLEPGVTAYIPIPGGYVTPYGGSGGYGIGVHLYF